MEDEHVGSEATQEERETTKRKRKLLKQNQHGTKRRRETSSNSKDSDTPPFVQGEDQTCNEAKQPPNETRQKRSAFKLKKKLHKKKKRYRGDDYDEVITVTSENEGGEDVPTKKIKKGKSLWLVDIETPYQDDDDEVLPKQIEAEGSIKENNDKVEAFSNTWTKEDEITILKGLINFKFAEGNKQRKIDYVALYELIKQSLSHKSATVICLKKKVKCLREKYNKIVKRGRTLIIPHEVELFNLSDKIWGDVDNDHEINQQLTRQNSTSSSFRAYKSLDPQAADKIFVGELGLALTAMASNQSNPKQVALEQYKLISQSLDTRKSYASRTLEVLRTSNKDPSGLEEQKIARSYYDMKIQHTQLFSDAYNASIGFGQ